MVAKTDKEVYIFFFFFYVGFFSWTFTNHRTAGEGGGHFFNSSLPLLPASQTLRHEPGDYCRELTSAHNQQSDSNREPLVSESESLTTKMHSYFSFVFSTVPKKVQCLKILKVMWLIWKSLPPPCKNGREEGNKFFGQSLLHPVVFQKRKYQVFWSSFGSCSLQLPDQLPYDCLHLGLKILPILQRIFTCLWQLKR